MSTFDRNWFKNEYGSKVLQTFRKKDKIRTYGLIEKPILPGSLTQYEEFKFKVLVLGRSFSGKTSFINSFLSSKINDKGYIETPGIQITNFYWPVKMVDSDKLMIFNLGFWDIGDSILKKYAYIQPSCAESIDCRIFVFSWTDKQSFTEVFDILKEQSIEGNTDKIPNLIVGTKFDQVIHSEIDPKSINEIEKLSNTRIINFSAMINQPFDQLSLIMNRICEVLWDKKNS